MVSDRGVSGLVIEIAHRGLDFVERDNITEVRCAAGEPWDAFVRRCVDDELAGIECLASIPGRVGATPIQNVGAYGQDVSETIVRVRAYDLSSQRIVTLSNADCAFGYRHSRFKDQPNRFVVLSVDFALRRGGPPAVRYAELERALADAPNPTLRAVSDTVRALRRAKSMVIDPDDPNRKSAGSFFTNPVVSASEAEQLIARALEQGIVESEDQIPRWDAPGGVKLAAGWLIERAGIAKGMRRGAVGISSAHALALVHHGGGSTDALLALADEVRVAVAARFGVTLNMEPTRWP